jgi:hypothetical protein
MGRCGGDAGGHEGAGCPYCGGDGWSCAVWAVAVKERQLCEVSSVAVLGHGKKGGAAADFRSSYCCKNGEKKRCELQSWGVWK